jgi:hypothetical protein
MPRYARYCHWPAESKPQLPEESGRNWHIHVAVHALSATSCTKRFDPQYDSEKHSIKLEDGVQTDPQARCSVWRPMILGMEHGNQPVLFLGRYSTCLGVVAVGAVGLRRCCGSICLQGSRHTDVELEEERLGECSSILHLMCEVMQGVTTFVFLRDFSNGSCSGRMKSSGCQPFLTATHSTMLTCGKTSCFHHMMRILLLSHDW